MLKAFFSRGLVNADKDPIDLLKRPLPLINSPKRDDGGIEVATFEFIFFQLKSLHC